MQKKKIIKLEIKKEDILNLSIDEAHKVIGGGDTTVIPVTKASDCNTDQCSRYCEVETDPCSGVIEYTDICGMTDNCGTGGGGQITQEVSPECNRT